MSRHTDTSVQRSLPIQAPRRDAPMDGYIGTWTTQGHLVLRVRGAQSIAEEDVQRIKLQEHAALRASLLGHSNRPADAQQVTVTSPVTEPRNRAP